jgi:SSS family solute:Na+ symporter
MALAFTIDTWIVILYMAALFVMAIVSARKIHSMEDYAVSARNYPAWVIYATMCATFVGGGFTMGNAEKVHVHGIVFMIAISAISLREILVSYFIAPHMWRFKEAISIGDIMKEAYGMPAKIMTGLFAGVLCAGIIGVQLKAMGTIFEVFFGLDHTLGILIGCGMVIFYVTIGGFKAVVWTDVLQFTILIIALPLAAIMAVHAAGGPSAMMAAIPPDRFDLFMHFSPLAFLSVIAYFLFGEALAPPYIQRLLAGNAKEVSRGALWAGLTALPLGLVVGIMALAALALSPSSQPHEVIPYIISTVLPIGMSGFVIAAMLAVIMSSADSYLNSASVNLVNDVTKPLFPKGLTNKQELWLTQIFTLTIGIGSIFFAISFEDLFDGILKVYGLWAPVVLVPIIAAIRGFQGNVRVFIIVSLSGLITSVAWDHHFGEGTGITGMFLGTCMALIVFLMMYAARRHH